MSVSENSQSESLVEVTARLLEVRAERARLDADYKRAVRSSDGLIAALEQRIRELNANFDMTKLFEGRRLLHITGKYIPGEGDHDSVVADAIKWFATGEPASHVSSLGEGTYYGVKNYAHWSGQRSDHPQWAGPRHGSLVFRIGLRDHTKVVAPDEAEACLYYLHNLEKIQTTQNDYR